MWAGDGNPSIILRRSTTAPLERSLSSTDRGIRGIVTTTKSRCDGSESLVRGSCLSWKRRSSTAVWYSGSSIDERKVT